MVDVVVSNDEGQNGRVALQFWIDPLYDDSSKNGVVSVFCDIDDDYDWTFLFCELTFDIDDDYDWTFLFCVTSS